MVTFYSAGARIRRHTGAWITALPARRGRRPSGVRSVGTRPSPREADGGRRCGFASCLRDQMSPDWFQRRGDARVAAALRCNCLAVLASSAGFAVESASGGAQREKSLLTPRLYHTPRELPRSHVPASPRVCDEERAPPQATPLSDRIDPCATFRPDAPQHAHLFFSDPPGRPASDGGLYLPQE